MHKHRNKFCHPAQDEQQRHAAPASATTAATTTVSQHTELQQKYMAGICKYIPVRRTAANNSVVELHRHREELSFPCLSGPGTLL